ncbi:MAG: ribose-5-phosphate isomerase RpiA [Deltaproteobacteria bacterium]
MNPSSLEATKQQAAEAALAWLPERGVVGLGSGSTSAFFIEALARLVAAGRELWGVATSMESRRHAEALGVSLLSDAGPWSVDVCVDGADEVSRALDLIKGGGGCHTREKIVNRAAAFNVIIVDESKLSGLLGEKWPIPVEVLPFGMGNAQLALERWGTVTLRQRQGRAFVTDSGNYILDLHAGPLTDPSALDRQIQAVPGVVETGLFIARADVVVVASEQGIRELRPR